MVQTEATATAGRAHFTTTVLFGDHRDAQAHQRTHISGQCAVGTRDQDHVVFTGQAGHYLRHTRIFGARHGFYSAQQCYFLGAIERSDGV